MCWKLVQWSLKLICWIHFISCAAENSKHQRKTQLTYHRGSSLEVCYTNSVSSYVFDFTTQMKATLSLLFFFLASLLAQTLAVLLNSACNVTRCRLEYDLTSHDSRQLLLTLHVMHVSVRRSSHSENENTNHCSSIIYIYITSTLNSLMIWNWTLYIQYLYSVFSVCGGNDSHHVL